jgi:hypothetical protein
MLSDPGQSYLFPPEREHVKIRWRYTATDLIQAVLISGWFGADLSGKSVCTVSHDRLAETTLLLGIVGLMFNLAGDLIKFSSLCMLSFHLPVT